MEWPVDMNLKIGDYIILKHAKPIEGCLGTDGISGDDVILTKDVDDIEHCLWQIHVQNQYSAMKEYEDFYYLQMYEQHGNADPFDDEDEEGDMSDAESETESETNAMLAQLRRAAANENTLNKKLMAMKLGKPLQFGDVFQLCHVQSKKMLTINSTVLAKHERENIRISLHPHGDALSWFEFIPRSKNDREGQHINNNTEAFIRVHERPSEFIHTARKPLRENENIREINCSLESSCWNVCIYQEGLSILSSNISAGQLISFQEPESSTYLTLEEVTLQDRERESMRTPPRTNQQGVEEEEDEPINLQLSTATPMTFSPSGNCTIGTNLLWQIEKENRHTGGSITSRIDKVSFRHLNSGLFLSLESDALTAVALREQATLFEVYPASQTSSSDGNCIQNNSTVQLGEHGRWMRLPNLLLSGMATKSRINLHLIPEDGPADLTSVRSTSSLLEQQDFVIGDRNGATPLRVSSNLFQVIGVDLYVGVKATQFLKHFVKSIKEGTLMDDSMANVERVVKTLFSVLHNVLDFITDNVNTYGNDDNMVFSFDDVVRGDKKTFILKQTMMREQGVLTQILNIIELCGNGDLEHLPDTIRRRRRRTGAGGGGGKQNSKSNTGMLKSPTSRQLIRATSTFKTLVGQLSEDNAQGSTKDRSLKNIARMATAKRGLSRGLSRALSRQGSNDGGILSRKNSVAGEESVNVTQRRNSLLGLKMVQENISARRSSMNMSEKTHSRMFANQSSKLQSSSFGNSFADDGKSPMGNREDFQNLVKGLRSISHDISTVCFKTLLAIIEDNHSNQMYIADKFPIILHQIKDQALAVTCVQEMLHDNLQMLQTKVREREIDIFLDLLEESEMNVTLLHLLRSTCSCPMGVDSTQRMVAKALLGGSVDKKSEESKDSLQDDSVPLLQLPMKSNRLSTMKINVLTRLTADEHEKNQRPSHNYRNLLIRVDMSETIKERSVTWPSKSIYFPDDSTLTASILGYHLIQDGIPRLSVNWSCNDGFQLDMLSLFGFSKDVPYEYFCNIARYDSIKKRKDVLQLQPALDGTDSSSSAAIVNRSTSMSVTDNNSSSRKITSVGRKKNTKRSTIIGSNRLSINSVQKVAAEVGISKKVQVADYFCAQLYLLADLCLDRNYVSMKLVEATFPYEMLISMLKIPNSSQRFKAPVCRLLKCLYVDREPQTEAKFPRLIRTSVSLSGGEENSFEDHHEGSPYKFSILQQIISEYIHHELDTTNCDELSAEMLELLLSLIKFGFYTSLSQLQDVIIPLTKALGDHRNISTKKRQRKKQPAGFDAANNSDDPANNSRDDRRNAMAVNLKPEDLQTLQAPSLASSLFGRAPPTNSALKTNTDRDDSMDLSTHTTTTGFWDSFRKLGKNGVSPDTESIGAKSIQEERSGSSGLSGMWTKILAPVAFMRGIRSKGGVEKESSPSTPKSPRVQMMKDLKKQRSSRRFFWDDDSTPSAVQDEKDKNDIKDKKEKSDFAKSKDGKHKTGHVITWEERTLQFTENLYFVSFFVFLVFASTIVAIIQVANIEISFYTTQVHFIVDIAFTAVFLLEVLVRMYCTYRSQNEILSFFINPLKFVDVFIVLLDVFVLLTDVFLGGQSSYVNAARFLKVLRMFRIIRLIRAARLINTIASNSYRHQQYVVPERYSTTTEFEVRTITGIIKVMSAVHDRIQDRKLGLCIQYFSDWFNDAILNKARDPKEVYAQLCAETGMTNAFPPKFDAMLVDVVMYNDPKLTDDALQLLMVHESQEELFLSIAKQVQIIYSSKLERLYRSFVSDLKKLKSLAESYELWGAAVDDGTDMTPANNMVEILENLCSHLNVKSEMNKLESGPSSERDPEVQQLLFNLDAMSIFMSIQHSLLDGQIDNPTKAIQNIVRVCNETIILFVTENEVNQNLAFKHFNWFLDRIDDNIGSSRVTKAIIAGNRNLMKQCPKTLLSDFMKNIVAKGRKPEYLDLLVGMTEIVDNGDSGVISLRHEISRSVTNRDRVKFLIEWCDAPHTPGYEERKAAMAPYVGLTVPVSNIDLPVQLQYHINLLTLLSGLKLGQKLQAVYAIEDIIAAILDEDTIFNVRKCLGILLEELVENKIDGLDSSECIWEYFMYCETMFDDLLTDLPKFMNRDQFYLRFQNAAWIKSTLLVIIHFFDNFDFLIFRETAFDSESAFKVTGCTESDIQLVIFNLHHSIKAIKKTHGHRLGVNLTSTIEEALLSLSHLIVQVNTEEETKTAPQGRRASLVGSKAKGGDSGHRNGGRADEIHEAFYRKQYLTFLEALRDDHNMYNLQAMKIFEKLPSIKDSMDSDVRLEYFVIKISSHIRSRVTSSGAAKNLDVGTVTAAKWVLDTWTHLIQKEFGQIALDDLADPQRIVDLPHYTRFQEIFNNCGATVLCLDLIAINMDPSLIHGAIKLLVVLLSGSGGNPMVQQTIFEYLYETDSVLFFEQMKDLLEQQMMWCQRKAEMKNTSADSVDVMPDSILCLKVLSAMCDNFCINNKNIVREQNGNSRFVNLLDSLASYVDLLSRLEDHTCVKICSRVIHTILCFVQGPCKGNQEHFVLHTNLLAALNRIMRLTQSSIQIRPKDWSCDIETLKEYAFELLHACIEGQHSGSVVLERVQVAMELNVLNVLIIPSELDEFGDVIELSELSDLQATYLVFLQNLSSSNQNIEIPLNAKRKIQSDVACIEVIWNKEVAIHYFNIPPLALDITMPSKERLIEAVDLSSQEAKLKDFLKRGKDLYGEAVHFQTLKSLGIVDIWNFKQKLSWIMLFNVIVMNILMVIFYETDSDDKIYLPDAVNTIIFAMNAFHILFAVCSLSTYLIVRVPVLYWSYLEYGDGVLMSFFKAVTDPMPLWYSIYLGVSVLSLLNNYLFLSILLLDFIVMDSTSRDIMNAVIYPARQLATALIIIMIMVNIFSGAVFYFFRNDFDLEDVHGGSLFDTFKLLITFGVRANEGVGAYMTPNIHSRFILDMFFFLIIVVILMNIFFGIIIDTFGKLRNLKVEREADEANKCFICGVEEQYFLKHTTHIADGSGNEGFKHHRRVTHDMWNYLYFAMKIWQQPRDLDNSVEMHIRSCMERGDISWFPIGIFNTESNNAAVMGLQHGDSLSNNKTLALGDRTDAMGGGGGGGGGGGMPSSPRRKNSNSNLNNNNANTNQALLHDFARLEEMFTQKLNTLGDNIATLASYSVQNTMDENYIISDQMLQERPPLDVRKSFRSSLLAANAPKKRETLLNKSKRENSSTKIGQVVDQVRAAMSEAVLKRQQAQRHLADLEEEMSKDKTTEEKEEKDGNKLRLITDESAEDMPEDGRGLKDRQQSENVAESEEQSQHLQQQELTEKSSSNKQLALSPSSRMLDMMRICFQQELAPLKIQMDELSQRVGQLETAKEEQQFMSLDPSSIRDATAQQYSFENEVEEFDLLQQSEAILGQTNVSPSADKSRNTQKKKSGIRKVVTDTKVKDPQAATKVQFKGVSDPFQQFKMTSEEGKKGGGKSKSFKKEKEGSILSKHEQKKAELKHVYMDTARPPHRVKSAPSHTPRPTSSQISSPTVSTSAPPTLMKNMQLEAERIKNVQAGMNDLARMKEDELIDVEMTSPYEEL